LEDVLEGLEVAEGVEFELDEEAVEADGVDELESEVGEETLFEEVDVSEFEVLGTPEEETPVEEVSWLLVLSIEDDGLDTVEDEVVDDARSTPAEELVLDVVDKDVMPDVVEESKTVELDDELEDELLAVKVVAAELVSPESSIVLLEEEDRLAEDDVEVVETTPSDVRLVLTVEELVTELDVDELDWVVNVEVLLSEVEIELDVLLGADVVLELGDVLERVDDELVVVTVFVDTVAELDVLLLVTDVEVEVTSEKV